MQRAGLRDENEHPAPQCLALSPVPPQGGTLPVSLPLMCLCVRVRACVCLGMGMGCVGRYVPESVYVRGQERQCTRTCVCVHGRVCVGECNSCARHGLYHSSEAPEKGRARDTHSRTLQEETGTGLAPRMARKEGP